MDMKYVSIEGNIGAGKTTLASLLAKQLPASLLLEQFEENPYLERFYQQPEAYNFHVEMYFLTERFKTLRQHFAQHPGVPVVADYAFHKSLYFAEVNLQQPELDVFRQTYELMREQLPEPELVLYLHHEVSGVQQRIKQRGRPYELSIQDTYLERVQQSYLEHMRQLNTPVVILNATDKDFINRPADLQLVTDLLHHPPETGLHYVGFE